MNSASGGRREPVSNTRLWPFSPWTGGSGSHSRGKARPWPHGDDDGVSGDRSLLRLDGRDGAVAARDAGHGGAAQLGAMRRGGAHHRTREAAGIDLRRRLGRAEAVAQGDGVRHPGQPVAARRPPAPGHTRHKWSSAGSPSRREAPRRGSREARSCGARDARAGCRRTSRAPGSRRTCPTRRRRPLPARRRSASGRGGRGNRQGRLR